MLYLYTVLSCRMRSINRFIKRKGHGLSREYLPGYPEAVPGHLLIGDVLGRSLPTDIHRIIEIFGVVQVRGVLGRLVEKGRIGTQQRKRAEEIISQQDDRPDIFRTL